jgi:hypothetical protein
MRRGGAAALAHAARAAQAALPQLLQRSCAAPPWACPPQASLCTAFQRAFVSDSPPSPSPSAPRLQTSAASSHAIDALPHAHARPPRAPPPAAAVGEHTRAALPQASAQLQALADYLDTVSAASAAATPGASQSRHVTLAAASRRVLDPRSVAFLSAKGLGTPAFVAALLRSRPSVRANLFPYDTVTGVYDFLERITGGAKERFRGSLLPLPHTMVMVREHVVRCSLAHRLTLLSRSAPQRYTNLLLHSPASLARKWDALCAPARDDPSFLASLLQAPPEPAAHTADAPLPPLLPPAQLGGAGLSTAQALRLVTKMPVCLAYSTRWVLARRAWLLQLGVPDAGATMASFPSLVGLALHTLDDKRELLQAHGLDATAVVAAMPTTLGLSRTHLEAKLSFARDVMGLTPDELQRAPVYLGLSLEHRTRPRFFLLEQLAAEGRAPLQEGPPGTAGAPRGPAPTLEGFAAPMTWLKQTDAQFLRRALRGSRAADWDVERVRAHVHSPAFGTYCDAREGELRAYHAANAARKASQQQQQHGASW